MNIEYRANVKIQFCDLKDGDLFLYENDINGSSHLFIKMNVGNYKFFDEYNRISTVNAVNLNNNSVEIFGSKTPVTKVNGTLVID